MVTGFQSCALPIYDNTAATAPTSGYTVQAGDVAPTAPVAVAVADGSVTVTPQDGDTSALTVDYTDETGTAQSVTATKGSNGDWTLPAGTPAGVTVNATTGVVTLSENAVGDGTTVSSEASDGALTTAGANVTAGNVAPTAPLATALTNGSVTVAPQDGDTTSLTVNYTDETGAAQTVIANKAGGMKAAESGFTNCNV